MDRRTELVDLLLDVAREREVDGQDAAASKLRRVAVAISSANDKTLVASGFVRLQFLCIVIGKGHSAGKLALGCELINLLLGLPSIRSVISRGKFSSCESEEEAR